MLPNPGINFENRNFWNFPELIPELRENPEYPGFFAFFWNFLPNSPEFLLISGFFTEHCTILHFSANEKCIIETAIGTNSGKFWPISELIPGKIKSELKSSESRIFHSAALTSLLFLEGLGWLLPCLCLATTSGGSPKEAREAVPP